LIDFAALYDHPLSRPCILWEKCDSHCCTMGRLLKPFDEGLDLVVLPIPEPEYAYLRSIGAPEEQWPDAVRSFELDLPGYSLTVHMQPCNLGGACDASLRPTICRLYPYVPHLDDALAIDGLMNASALDLLWNAGGGEDPCLLRLPEDRPAALAGLNDLVAGLARDEANLELLLWFNLTFRYLEAFKAYFDENLPGGASPELPLAEVLHLCNKTQLFLAEPGFREKLVAEVERFQQWKRR
jgi:hypothetical protein